MGLFDGLADAINAGIQHYKLDTAQGQETPEVVAMREQYVKIINQIESVYKDWVSQKKSEVDELEFYDIVNKTLESCEANKWGIGFIGYDFKPFDNVPETVRKSDYIKKYIQSRIDAAYQGASSGYLNKDANLDLGALMRSIEPLAYFEEIRTTVEHSIRHIKYFDFSRNIRSVLTGCDDIEAQLNSIYRRSVSENIMRFTTNYYDDVERLLSEHKFHEAFDRLTGADFDEEVFEDAKKGLLTAAINVTFASNDPEMLYSFDEIRKCVGAIHRVAILGKDKNDEHISYITTIPDVIIADAIVYQRSGSIDRIDEELSIFLNLGKDFLDQDQYEVLRRVFAYLKAYKQEKDVLESMVTHNVMRTEEQERRLVFLRNNINSLIRGEESLDHEVSYEKSDGKLVYDYRAVTWTDEQIKGYFDRLSGNSKTAQNILVATEWFNNLSVQKELVWDITQVQKYIEQCLNENFGDNVICKLIEASSLSGEYLEYEKVVFIRESAQQARYPWLAFVVNAEQMARRQISVSIYAIYVPELDFTSITDIYEKNKQTCAKFLSIKNKQNPKVNNYIYTMQTLLVDELEKYINSEINTGDIY